jgi:hypothetical protein
MGIKIKNTNAHKLFCFFFQRPVWSLKKVINNNNSNNNNNNNSNNNNNNNSNNDINTSQSLEYFAESKSEVHCKLTF